MFDTKLANYGFSRKPFKRRIPGVEFLSEPVNAFAQRLRATPGKHIRMTGGRGLIAPFLDGGEIDEFDIHVISTLSVRVFHSWRRAIRTRRFACAQSGSARTASS